MVYTLYLTYYNLDDNLCLHRISQIPAMPISPNYEIYFFTSTRFIYINIQ